MPITDLASYLPTMDEFITHWSAVNASLRARGEGELILRDGRTLQEFLNARAELAALFHAVEAMSAQRTLLQEQRESLQEGLRARLVQFRDAILHRIPEDQHAEWAGASSSLASVEPRYLGELDAVARIWEKINTVLTDPPGAPLTLAPGYTLDEFREEIRRFRTVCCELRKVTRAYRALVRERSIRCAAVMDWLIKYRCGVRFERHVSRELLTSLPARTPSSYCPGRT